VPRLLTQCAVYLAAAIPGHFLWEIAQLPLYTIWQSGTAQEIRFAVLHCTGGDLMIASATLILAVILAQLAGWKTFGQRTMLAAIVLGIAYTIFSEWLNVAIRHSWAYAPAMPVLPPFGTGLSPLLQWLVVPALAFWVARRVDRIRRT